MSIAGVRELGKGDSLAGMVEGIGMFVEQAAAEGASLRGFERGIFDRLLKLGHAATEQFLALQGDGDRGEAVVDAEGRTLFRSEEPANRPLRTIFGAHQFEAYVDRRRKHPQTPIVLRPVDEQLEIGLDRWSPLLQEFTMLFGVEQAFDTAAESFEAIFRQTLSVDTLEQVSRRRGARAGEFLDSLEPPPADEEGELLVQTADGKGVPMVRDDAAKLKSFEEKPQRPEPPHGDAGRRVLGGPFRPHAGPDRRGAVPRRTGVRSRTRAASRTLPQADHRPLSAGDRRDRRGGTDFGHDAGLELGIPRSRAAPPQRPDAGPPDGRPAQPVGDGRDVL